VKHFPCETERTILDRSSEFEEREDQNEEHDNNFQTGHSPLRRGAYRYLGSLCGDGVSHCGALFSDILDIDIVLETVAPRSDRMRDLLESHAGASLI
jgi:hypothetical protein